MGYLPPLCRAEPRICAAAAAGVLAHRTTCHCVTAAADRKCCVLLVGGRSLWSRSLDGFGQVRTNSASRHLCHMIAFVPALSDSAPDVLAPSFLAIACGSVSSMPAPLQPFLSCCLVVTGGTWIRISVEARRPQERKKKEPLFST